MPLEANGGSWSHIASKKYLNYCSRRRVDGKHHQRRCQSKDYKIPHVFKRLTPKSRPFGFSYWLFEPRLFSAFHWPI